METLTLEALQSAIAGEYAGIRRTTRLLPVGDPKVFPPTYEGGEYATEPRKVATENGVAEVQTVLLDSVQSQANRMELALLRAYQAGKLRFPLVQIDFATGENDPMLAEIGTLTALELPHRITDALLRDSEFNGVRFRQSALGQSLDVARTANATPIYGLCPTALIFGFWDSTGPRGGLGAKVQRALVSEIVGYEVAKGVRTSSRIDPVVSQGVDIYVTAEGSPTADEAAAQKDKDGKPVKYGKKGKVSEINLGNVTPTITPAGVTMAYAEQTTVLSLAALRRLRFPVAGSGDAAAIDNAARTTLAALALAAICAQDDDGFDLRSRCLLDGKPGEFEFVGRGETRAFGLTAPAAFELANAAAQRAAALGLPWATDAITLKPSANLRLVVQKSRQKSMAASAEE